MKLNPFLIFILFLTSGESTSEVTAYSGGGVRVKCKYEEGYETNNKYFCKGESTPCTDQIKTAAKHTWVHKGRFSLYDDTSAKVFWVLMKKLTVVDSGTYQCGVDITLWGDKFTPVRLKVMAGGVASKEVTAYAGGGVTIKCRYEDEYKTKLKSFCKIGNNLWCLDQITTNQTSVWTHKDRFSIHDNRSAGFFSVIIRELSVKDTGTYQCDVIVSDQLHTYTGVKINVTEDLYQWKTINVYRGGVINISCSYPESHRSDPKFLCKRVDTDVCTYKTSVKESRRWINEGHMSVHDDRTKLILTVTIRDVTKQDSGQYWCGVESNRESDLGYKVYIRQIYLGVTEPKVSSSSSSSSSPSSPSSTDPHVKTATASTTSKTTVTSSPTTNTNTGSPSYTVISVLCVTLLLLLIGTSVLIVTLRQRRKKKQALSTNQSLQDSSHNHVVPLAVCDYEEIKDTRSHSVSDTGASTVYSTAHLPTNPSDLSQAVYTVAEPPSHSRDMDIYSTAQLPTIPSDSSVGSAPQLVSASSEGLIYATVMFHKKAGRSKNAVTKETFKEEEDSSDYATVNHVTGSG